MLLVSIVLAAQTQTVAEEASLEFFAVSDLVRVFEDGYNCPRPQKAIKIFGIRNECLSAQCVVKAGRSLQNVTFSVGPIAHVERSVALPPNCVRWNFVGSVAIDENAPNRKQSDLTRRAPARFPDYLSEEEYLALEKGRYCSVYLTVRIPADALPGDYSGTVTVHADKAEASLPLSITVYPLTLQAERHLMVTEWYTTGGFKRFHGIDSGDSEAFYDMLKVYAENMAEHRQNVFRVGLDLIEANEDRTGELTFDFSRFDRWAEVFWSTGRMDLLETGFVAQFGEGGWSSNRVSLRDFRVHRQADERSFMLPGKEFLPRFLPALENHLRQKGWLDKTVFHIADEPSNHNVMSWRDASQFVHDHGPALRRMDAIETTHCFDALEIWVPKLDHLAMWMDAYEKARAGGNELWFYTVGIYQGGSLPNKTVDVPLIESRILHWINYRFALKGYLHWGYNHWTDDPFGAPGKHLGDGWHVYPKKDGLLDSVRWEQMRNGIQDYEYFRLLEDKIRAMKGNLRPRVAELIDPSRRPVEIASQVVRTIYSYNRDPNALYAAKRQLVEELLDLDRSPRLILQTNPLERSTVGAGCAVDVFGWAEPETTIMVNGRPLPVADDGLFMENVSVSKDSTIVVEAKNKAAGRKIVRYFDAIP